MHTHGVKDSRIGTLFLTSKENNVYVSTWKRQLDFERQMLRITLTYVGYWQANKKSGLNQGKKHFPKKTFWYLRMSLVPSKILKILRSRMTFSRPSAFMNPFPPSTCSHSKTLTMKGTPTKCPTSKGPASKGPRYERSGVLKVRRRMVRKNGPDILGADSFFP